MAGMNDTEELERYINIPEHLETGILLACLSSHFDAKRIEKPKREPKFYKQYKEWLQKTPLPSAKAIYNTLRKLTPIVKREKKIIFTITKGYGVFYRIKESYLKNLCENIMKDNTAAIQLLQEHQAVEESNSDNARTLSNVSEDSVNDKEGLFDIDTASLEEVVEDMNKKLEQETKFLKTNMDDSYMTQSPLDETDISLLVKRALETEIPVITSTIKKDIEVIYKERMDSIESKYKQRINLLEEHIASMEKKVTEHHKQMEITLEKSRKMSDTLRHRSHYCMETMKEVSASVENATADMTTTIEDLVELKTDDIVDRLNDTMEMAEQDIAATMISFHKTVKSNSAGIPAYDKENQRLTQLRDQCNEKMDTIEKRCERIGQMACDKMDETLAKKMTEFGKHMEGEMTNFKTMLNNSQTNTQSTQDSSSRVKHSDWTNTQHQNEIPYSQFHTKTQTASNHNPYKRNTFPMVNTEYLRKNVKHTCSDRSQVLDFYMKLRTTIKAGGIYIKEIEKIELDATIMEETPGSPDYTTQSNALYTILANEDIIPSDYVEAQNKIMSRNNTQDGFAALKAILMTVHPSLTRKPPPSITPTYSKYGDISLYEHAVRNYFLMHYLYSGYKHTELQKTQQFLRGLDDDVFTSAIQRVVNQIDNVRNFGGDVPEQYTINAISGTIQNMNEYGDKLTPTVNMMQRYHKDTNNKHKSQKPATQKQNRRKLVNAQCGGCKAFGHKMIDCNMIGRVLAIHELLKTHPTLCKKILTNHISKNDPAKRMAIVRSLQQCDIISPNTSAEDCILDESINDTIDCTINAADSVIVGDSQHISNIE